MLYIYGYMLSFKYRCDIGNKSDLMSIKNNLGLKAEYDPTDPACLPAVGCSRLHPWC